MSTRKRVNIFKPWISERLVTNIWQYQLVATLNISTGEELKVIYPGRVCNDSGGDFKDGVFIIGKDLIYGDVEVHIRSSQWHAHGHNRDHKYNGVVLHVVMWQDDRTPTLLQCGRFIPMVNISQSSSCLQGFSDENAGSVNTCNFLCPEATKYRENRAFMQMLTYAGKRRFKDNVEFFSNALKNEGPDEVLFRGIAGALGYAKNQMQFKRLAEKIISGDFHAFAKQNSITRRAILLGAAGLLPSQRSVLKNSVSNISKIPEINALESIWHQRKSINETMNIEDWSFFRVRPDNYPTRRVVALGYLIDRYSSRGLAEGILNLIRKQSNKGEPQNIESGFILLCNGYWSDHIDFGIAKIKGTAMIGQARAREMVINVVLPFVSAWGELFGELSLISKVEGIYNEYPKMGENQLTCHMRSQFVNLYGVSLSACQQQGLIHIYKMYCRYRNCTECMVKFRC
jgi:hypothetical protein